MDRNEIQQAIIDILVENFELDAAEIKPESTLYEELDLDSIDAVDIFVSLREITGRRPDPEKAKDVRTVADLVDFTIAEIAAKEAGEPEPDVQKPTNN